MKSTGNELLDIFREKFYDLTFMIGDAFLDLYNYDDRLERYKNEWVPAIRELRQLFLEGLAGDEELLSAYFLYNQESVDLVMLFNALLAAPDQRKYGSDLRSVPFIIYPFQLVIGEFSNRDSMFVKKCRDMGLSMLCSGIDSGKILFLELLEVLYVSEKQDKVDVAGDRTQSCMGRIRYFLENSGLCDLRSFLKDIKLHLWRTEQCKIDGSSTTSTAANGYRYQYGRADEIGLYDSEQFLIEAQASFKYLTSFSTLKLGSDDGFRKGLLESFLVDYRPVFQRFRELVRESDLSYTEIWDQIYSESTAEKPKGQPIRVDIDFRDHPLKTGECDFLAIESKKLLNDETAIAIQLWASLEAGNDGRSLRNLSGVHFEASKVSRYLGSPDNWKQITFHAGFDPGGHDSATFVPVATDRFNFSYVLPALTFKTGSISDFLNLIIEKYGKKVGYSVHVYSDSAINQYKDEGGLWWDATRKQSVSRFLDFRPYSNRGMDAMRLLVNSVLAKREYHPATGERIPLITFAEENRKWAMGYETDGKKKANQKQAALSHAHDAFIYFAYNYYKQLPEFEFDSYYVQGV